MIGMKNRYDILAILLGEARQLSIKMCASDRLQASQEPVVLNPDPVVDDGAAFVFTGSEIEPDVGFAKA